MHARGLQSQTALGICGVATTLIDVGFERSDVTMLSGEALDIAFALRLNVGPLSQGDGPTVEQLRHAVALSETGFARALAELESVGFIALAGGSSGESAVVVLAPLQIYLDDLENQGSDDF